MLRKMIKIFVVLGFICSVILWAVSYYGLRYEAYAVWEDQGRHTEYWSGINITQGGVDIRVPMPAVMDGYQGIRHDGVSIGTTRSFKTNWQPFSYKTEANYRLFVPLWIFVLFFALCCRFVYGPVLQRRRRRKLGLCPTCGHDVRHAPGVCPNCGSKLSSRGA